MIFYNDSYLFVHFYLKPSIRLMDENRAELVTSNVFNVSIFGNTHEFLYLNTNNWI